MNRPIEEQHMNNTLLHNTHRRVHVDWPAILCGSVVAVANATAAGEPLAQRLACRESLLNGTDDSLALELLLTGALGRSDAVAGLSGGRGYILPGDCVAVWNSASATSHQRARRQRSCRLGLGTNPVDHLLCERRQLLLPTRRIGFGGAGHGRMQVAQSPQVSLWVALRSRWWADVASSMDPRCRQ